MTDNHSPDTSGVAIFPPGAFLAALIVGYIVHWFLPLPIVPAGMDFAIRVLGVLALLLGGWFMFSAAGLFAKLGTAISPFEPSTALATDGPYRFSRNPIYLGMALILGGFAGIGNALWPLLAVIPAIVVTQTQVIAREEAYLEAKFGNEYRTFKGRVRRWI